MMRIYELLSYHYDKCLTGKHSAVHVKEKIKIR